MRTLKVSKFVPGRREQVFEYVTAFPLSGQFDLTAMEKKYGRFLERNGNTFSFLENVGGGIKWECVFDPPEQRVMRAIDSPWSDRIDRFEEADGGTRWTITWSLKARGPAVFTQWLTFQLKARSQINANIIGPVVAHFNGLG